MVANILKKEKIFTIEEYYKLEEKSFQKNEFFNGKITAMPNTTINHNRISGNIHVHLSILSYQNGTFEVFNPEQKIYLPKYNLITYPDGCAILGEIQQLDKYSITNPTVIFEVASPSTIKYDRGLKFKKYQSLPSFEQYVLIDQDTSLVEVLTKTSTGWAIETYINLDETVQLKSIDCEIKMTDIYRNVENLEHPQGKMDL